MFFVKITIIVLCFMSNLTFAYHKSITNIDQPSGKWLITLSVGGGLPEESTIALRNVVVPFFSSVKGGSYNHFIDLDDVSSVSYSADQFYAAIKQLRKKISSFKHNNPTAQTMVLFSLAGHGKTNKAGEYKFLLSPHENVSISGRQIVELIKELNVDETIMILQSCQSGSLPSIHFETGWHSALQKEINKEAIKNQMAISVVVPVHQFIDSPSYIWEEVLQNSFSDNADFDGNMIVTYEEWKNYLLQSVFKLPQYTPISMYNNKKQKLKLPKDGIDPQFYENQISANLPFFLTNNGVKEYLLNQFIMPALTFRIPLLYPGTTSLQRKQTKLFEQVMLADSSYDLLQPLKQASIENKIILLKHLMSNKLDFDMRLLGYLYRLLRQSDNVELQKNIVEYLTLKGYQEGENAYFDQTFIWFLNTNLLNNITLRPEIINAIRQLKVLSAEENMIALYDVNPDWPLRNDLIMTLATFGTKSSFSFVLSEYKLIENEHTKDLLLYHTALVTNKKNISDLIEVIDGEEELINQIIGFLTYLNKKEVIKILQESLS